MTKQPMQATGDDGRKGAPDGVSDAPSKHGGESQGGGYEGVPKRDKPDYHGGQSGTAYHGSGGHPDPDKDNGNAPAEEG